MENLSFLYPPVYLILCGAAALAVTLILYYRNKIIPTTHRWQQYLLGSLRFLVSFLLAALLLSPFLKYQTSTIEKPIIVFGADVSESVPARMKPEQVDNYQRQLNQLANQLSGDYAIHRFSFGDGIHEGFSDSFADPVTDITQFLDYVYDQYNDQNLGAVILASDGLYNEGKNPVYGSKNLKAPVYGILLGDTTVQKDARIENVYYNDIVYLGDRFQVQIDVQADACDGDQSSLQIFLVEGENRTRSDQASISINRDPFFQSYNFILEADKPGIQHFRIALAPVPGEEATSNNYKDIYVDVLDARQNVLLLASTPHPDLAAIRQSLEKNKNYQVTTKLFGDQVDIQDYDLVVFDQLPAPGKSITALLKTMNDRKINRWFILGADTDINAFNQVQNALSITTQIRNTDEVTGELQNSFGLFNLSDALKDFLTEMPPLQSPFGEYNLRAGTTVLMNQVISKVETNYPLWLFHQDGELKTGILTAEGIWKWRLYDFLNHQDHQLIDELIDKTVQYLALQEDKRQFRVYLPKKIFRENEIVRMDAELYNQSYELVNDPDVFISIYNEKREEFRFTMDRRGLQYTLQAGYFPEGNYTYRATTTYNNEELTFNGSFSIQPVQLEMYNLTADRSVLESLAGNRNGKVVLPDAINTLSEQIKARQDVKPVAYAQSVTQPLLMIKWLFFILFALATIEWFLRRFWGGY
ncbi:MAG: hypothetical protein KDC59_01140 [Saprospiraceae bacterium]|nr:hypothetical protein [Saprospiraceae bacterium]HPG05516.1 hypothetical protein [Saprospiraceae bacterium]